MARGNKVRARSAINAAVGAVALVISSTAARAQTYTVTDIGSQISGNNYGAVPMGINSSDQVVGYYNSTATYGAELPFAYTPGSGAVTIPNINPYYQTEATAINNSGIVVGTGIVTGSSTSFAQGFVYNANTGSFTAVAPLAVENSSYEPNLVLTGINNSGLAVGYSFTNANSTSYRAITYNVSSGGTPTDIGSNFSGPVQNGAGVGNSNEASGINDSGVIAGVGPNTGGTASFSTTGDYYIATPTSGGAYPTSSFVDITAAVTAASNGQYSGVDFSNLYVDAAGDVAGTFKNTQSTHSYDGFLYTAKTGTAVLIDSGLNQTQVNGLADVNGNIEVVGYTSVFGNSQAFIYSNGTFTDVYSTLAPGYDVLSIDAINSKGDLAVVATPTSGGTLADAFLLTVPAVATDYYFTGATNSSWATQPNFATTHTGATAQGPIASGSNVFLTADSATHAASQTLDGSYTLNSLTFTGTSTAGAGLAISLAPGSGGTLTINAANAFTATTAAGSTSYAAGIGMVVQSGSGGDTISAPIVLGNSQTWEVDTGGTLSVTGGIGDGGAGLALSKTGSGLLVLAGTNTYSGGTSVNGGTLIVANQNALPANKALNIASGATVAASATSPNFGNISNPDITLSSLSVAGTLNLNQSPMVVNYTSSSPLASITTSIASGNITSSTVQASPTVYGLGTKDTGSAVEVLPTLLGDTQLRGTVGIGDYDAVLTNFGSGSTWTQGDFHYSGVVGIGDYDNVLSNYGAHVGGGLSVGPSLARSISPAASLNPDVAKTDLKLEVNTTTGDVYVLTTASAAFTGYTISDPSDHLLGGSTSPDPDKLLSVSAGNGGNTNVYETSGTYVDWFKITETASQVAEGQQQNGFGTHSSRDDTINIPAGGTIDFGDIYNTAAAQQDLTFDFAEAGTEPTNGPTYYGAEVDYVTTPEPATLGVIGLGALALLRRRRRSLSAAEAI
jgi:autotransporter-associated beta strand protein